MSQLQELDPRVQGFEKKAKLIGVGVVALVAAAVIIITGGVIIVASITAVVALAVVNFVPVAARWLALKKQQSLTALAETFSEETIREDERLEGDRVAEQQRLYTIQSAELGNVIDELRANMTGATSEEHDLLQGQIDQLDSVLTDAEKAVNQKVVDLAELKRVNKIYVSFQRAAKVLKSSQDLKRNAEQIQQVETARNAIKTRMREAVAGQKLEAMNAPLRQKLSVSSVAQIASQPSATLVQPLNLKENVNVPRDR